MMPLPQFQIMSDLHLETHPLSDFDFPRTAPYLALLGDIGHVEDQRFFDFLERQLKRYSAVFYLLGNHDAFYLSLATAKRRMQEFNTRVDCLRSGSGDMGRFIFLDKSRYDLSDSLTILGCTLYSKITSEQAPAVAARLGEFRKISAWDINQYNNAHFDDVAWLNSEVRRIERTEPGRSIAIFTHHSPCADDRASDPTHRDNGLDSGFVTDLSTEECWRSHNVCMWAFGHTHFNCDFRDPRGKRVVANQRGHAERPQPTFRSAEVFQVGSDLDKA